MPKQIACFTDYKEQWTSPNFRNQFDEMSIVSENCEISGSILGFYSRLKKFVEFRESMLGDYSYVSSFSVVNGTEIGRFSSIAHGAFIGLWEHNVWVTTHSFYLFEGSGGFVKGNTPYEADKIKTYIGNDVWIGANAVVLKGVKIGDGAIVGAGSVVTKDVPPYAIVLGSPARVHKYRCSEEDIKLFLEAKWWDLSREEIQYLVDHDAWLSIDRFKEIWNERYGKARP
ncbi:MAG: CatB-related O-acetyltransferase [Acidobacteriota bacterium]